MYVGHGDLAQLGERLPCTQEARGSIPLLSTTAYELCLGKCTLKTEQCEIKYQMKDDIEAKLEII